MIARTAVTSGMLLVLALVACKSKPGTETVGSATATAAAAEAPAAGSARKLKGMLSHKQLTEAWAGLKGNLEFKKHSELVTEKLGPAHAVNGDQSCWYGYKPAEGPVPDDCVQLCTSATKGSGTQAVDGAGKCWE